MYKEELYRAFSLASSHKQTQKKQGQAKIIRLRKEVDYPIKLLSSINNNHFNFPLQAAIELKLWCTSYEELQPFERSYYQQVIVQIKSQIVHAYLVMPNEISETLRPGIVKLTNVGFPKYCYWKFLMIELMDYASQNSNSIHSVLLLIQDITKKYSILSRSDPLCEEIILVWDQTHDFLLDLTVKIIQSDSKDHGTLELLEALLKIFYHLNYQGLHTKFEENANNWMSILKQIMGFANEDQTIFKCKGAALQSILLYANKYKEDMEELIKGFFSEIWDLCSNATDDPEYDTIVFNCLKYLKSIILWQEMKPSFVDNLGQLIQKLIMPNLNINQNVLVLKMFKGSSGNFFEYYFKNNDIQTRRSASLDLLRVIWKSFPNFESYVIQKIQKFAFNMSNTPIQQKCNLLNFIIDASTKSFSDVDGCTDTYIDNAFIAQCFQNILCNDLNQIYDWIRENQTQMIEDNNNLTLLITQMRFCYFFRIFIPTEKYEGIIKVAAAINTNSNAIQAMLFMTINAFLTVRHGDFVNFKNFKPYFNSQNSHGVTNDILQTIYKNDNKVENILNQNVTKILYTLVKTLGQGSVQYYEYFDALIPQMLLKTGNSDFNSCLFLFQAIGVIALYAIKKFGQEKVKLENHIFNYFNCYVSLKTNSNLLNVCFQILAIFCHFQYMPENKQEHLMIYNSITKDDKWIEDEISVMSSYIQYISAHLNRSSKDLISDKINYEKISQRLLKLQQYDLFFRFFESILKVTSIKQFYENGYFKLSIMRSEAAARYYTFAKKKRILFIFKLMNNYDLKQVVQCMDKVQPNLFPNLIRESDDIIRTMELAKDRKLIYLALCKVISFKFLSPQIEGSILSLLIENLTKKFSHSNMKSTIEGINHRKLQIFVEIQRWESDDEVDEEKELCKTYMICENGNRFSLSLVDIQNQERIARLKEKHSQSLGLEHQGTQGGNRRIF